jgi:CRISPR-associated protein Csb3
MVARNWNIRLEPNNPGQVFACMGILGVADVLGDARACFKWNGSNQYACFSIEAEADASEIVSLVKNAEVRLPQDSQVLWEKAEKSTGGREAPAEDVEEPGFRRAELLSMNTDVASREESGRAGDKDKGRRKSAREVSATFPVLLVIRDREFLIDPWIHPERRTLNNGLKLWAGQGNSEGYITKYQEALPASVADANGLFFIKNQLKDETRPSGYDPRSAIDSQSLGFSYNDLDFSPVIYPIVDMLANIGLASARPRVTSEGYSTFEYYLWKEPFRVELARMVLTGGASWLASFKMVFRIRKRGNYKYFGFADLVKQFK